MNVVSVCSPCNGCGKTTLIETILKTFPGRCTVLKCTTIYTEETFCPVGEKECACRHLEGDFCFIDDPEKIGEKDTDTGRFVAAGARQVYWAISRPGYHRKVWELVRSRVEKGPLLVEGNSLTRSLQPALLLFVVNPFLPTRRYKADTGELAARCDYLILNVPPGAGLQGHEGSGKGIAQFLNQTAWSNCADPGRLLVEDVGKSFDRWQSREPFLAMEALVGP